MTCVLVALYNFCRLFLPGVIAFPDEDRLLHYFEQHRTNRDFAIVFEQPNQNDDKDAPTKLNYTIRTRNNNFRTDEIYVNDVFEVAMKDVDEYIDSGFLALQQSLDRCYLEYAGVDLSSYEVTVHGFEFVIMTVPQMTLRFYLPGPFSLNIRSFRSTLVMLCSLDWNRLALCCWCAPRSY